MAPDAPEAVDPSESADTHSNVSRTTQEKHVASLLYVESSALLAALLEEDADAVAALRGPGRLVTSALTITESYRGLVRARVSARLDTDRERLVVRALRTFESRCGVISVTPAILERAGRPFPVEPIRTLDAIHLATAEALGEPPALVTVLTRDSRVRQNAAALGYALA